MKSQCIIFVIDNEEKELYFNLNKILELKKEFDLYFVTRKNNIKIKNLLKNNNLINIEMSYDSGYYEALRTGFSFVKNYNYKSLIEFGEIGKIDINEIWKMYNINKDYNNKNSVLFASKYKKTNKIKKWKLYIYLVIRKKISDPYTKFRMYNTNAIQYIRKKFDFITTPQNFIELLYRFPNFVEIKTQSKKLKIKFGERFNLFIYTILIFLYTKNFI